MKDNGNKKLIIISLLFMLCLLGLYETVLYYSNKDIEVKPVLKNNQEESSEVQLADEINGDTEEIALGDEDDGCKEYKMKDGYWTCGWPPDSSYKSAGGNGSTQCQDDPSINLPGCSKCYKTKPEKTKKCKTCKDRYNLKDDKCEMKCNVWKVEAESLASTVSVGEYYWIRTKVTFKSNSNDKCTPDNFNVEVTNGNGSKDTGYGWSCIDGDLRVCTYKQSIKTLSGCRTSDWQVTVGNTTKSGKVTVKSYWNGPLSLPGGCRPPEGDESTGPSEANSKGQDYYLSSASRLPGGEKAYCSYYKRGDCCICNPPPGVSYACYKSKEGEYRWVSEKSSFAKAGEKTSKSQKSCMNCYGTAKLFSLSEEVAWLAQPDAVHRRLLTEITSEAKCKKPEVPNSCVPTNVSTNNKSATAKVCEDSVDLLTTDGMTCKGDAFYTIECTNESKTKFDIGDNGIVTNTTEYLLVGQGFKFGILVTTSRTCHATFDDKLWKDTYEYTKKVIKKAKADKEKANAKELIELDSLIIENQKKQNSLKKMVSKYNNYDLSKEFASDASISLTYKVDNKKTTLNTKLVATTVQKGVGTYKNKKTLNLGVDGVTNPSTYDWSNDAEWNKGKTKPSIVKLIPPKQYLNSNTGEIASTGLDGGNKIYIDYYTNPGTYSLSITVNGLTDKSTITNNKCSIGVKNQDIIYRPIDVSNPFINNKWTPGSNWTNTSFDFRNIIKSDIWSTK